MLEIYAMVEGVLAESALHVVVDEMSCVALQFVVAFASTVRAIK